MKMNKKILVLLSTSHALTDLGPGALSMFLVFLQPVLALSQTQVGVVMLASNLSSSVIQPVFGFLTDRFQVAWLIPVGCLLAGLGMSFIGFSHNYPILLLAVLLSGLGVAAYHPEGSKFARFASGPRIASGMSLFSVGGNLGFAAGPVLANLFIGLAGLAGSAGFFALNGIMALLLLFYLSAIKGTRSGAPVQVPSARPEIEAGNPCSLSAASVAAPVALLVLVIIMRTWVHFGLVTFLPQYYVNYLHHSESYAAALTSLFLFAGVLGTIAGGPAADRWGLKTILVLSMASMVPLLYFFVHVSEACIPLVVILSGFALISTFAITVVFGQELLPNNVGLASGLTLGFAIGMGGVGATLLGWVADHWGLLAIFNVMIVFPVIGLLLSLFLPSREELSRRKAAMGIMNNSNPLT